MRDTTLRKLGLGSCTLLAVITAMSLLVSTPAHAAITCDEDPIGGGQCVKTCTDTVTTEVVSADQVTCSAGGGGTPPPGSGSSTCSEVTVAKGTGCTRTCRNPSTNEVINSTTTLTGPCGNVGSIDPASVTCTEAVLPGGVSCTRTCRDNATSAIVSTTSTPGSCGTGDPVDPSGGGGSGGGGVSTGGLGGILAAGCCIQCHIEIPQHHNQIRTFVTNEFTKHENWIIDTFLNEHVFPALALFAEQMTLIGMYQVEIIGAMLDAKHQLETQRIFQQMTARAHKDYHPSEGMCTFGTTVRSLAQSERKTNMAQIATATRMMQRQTLNGDAVSHQGPDSDMRSRLQTYISTYCDQADNQNRLNYLCPSAVPDPNRRNIDVDYTRNIESRLTLDMEFADIKDSAGNTPTNTSTVTPDEQDVFALAANLYSHNVSPSIEAEKLGNAAENRVRVSAAEKYIDLRSIYAKRSVAQNSFAALVGMRAAGDPESAPYVKKVMQDLGVSNPDDIEKLLGKNPSYFAQMEVLTKKLYQNPVFYTELYDKPANIKRKGAALQAIGLMQDRDLFNSFLRSEAVLSVLLETEIERAQERVTNQGGNLSTVGGTQ